MAEILAIGICSILILMRIEDVSRAIVHNQENIMKNQKTIVENQVEIGEFLEKLGERYERNSNV